MLSPITLYVDPSVVSVAAAAIAGVGAAISAAVIIWWRKAKKKVAEKLHLEEKGIKETEGEVTLIDDDEEI